MSSRGFFHEYSWGFTTEPTDSGRRRESKRLPLCQHSEEFLSWVANRYPDLPHTPTLQMLDEALLAVTKEYGFRKRFITPERFNTCIAEVFEELLDGMIDTQLELYRHWKPAPPARPALFIGEDEDLEEEE